MKTNCPHCNGEIVIQTRCCNGDEAISGIHTLAEHEANQEERKKENARKMQYDRDLENYTLQKTGRVFEIISQLDKKTESILELFQSVLCIWIVGFAIILFTRYESFAIKHSLLILSPVIFCGIISICLFISNIIFFIWKNILKRSFHIQYPEYEEFR
ncbi:MAG: hypothetical protein UW95_C0014G0004 [Parcubacteria group bacterium GW2011_GWC1_45_14]|nr:MAG: hypothetical protein UW87_C0028G0004 [Candidatus Moranbacteria bacterium GW2011_GWC2_45_10]KKT94511.1 MAG: hypothetical protein UW95_C0014G0004 [Parcubacteria group bacterium GW2011_GWC1_45_14]